MKKILFLLPGIFASATLLAQPNSVKPVFTNKILLSAGQKIIVQSSLTAESSLSPGVDVSNTTNSENTIEVRNISEKNYTLSSSLTKMQVNMNMPGNSTSYDSEKKEDRETDLGKTFSEKLNKPVEVILDVNTGKATTTQMKPANNKKETDEGNPMQGMLQVMGDAGGTEALVEGAFELIPQGKNAGDSWSDSSSAKNLKMMKTYTLKSVTGNEAVIGYSMSVDAVNSMEMQGMQMEISSITKSTGEIIVDILTGLVRKKTTQSDVQGNMLLMGQSIPVNAKATTTITYQ